MITLADLIGIPYRDRGRSLAGADCWGIVGLYHEHVMGARVPDYLGLYRSADDAAQAALAFALGCRAWERVEPESGQDGDVVLFRVMGLPSHCGVLIGPEAGGGHFLHTLKGRNATIEGLGDIGWRDRLEGVWRWTS